MDGRAFIRVSQADYQKLYYNPHKYWMTCWIQMYISYQNIVSYWIITKEDNVLVFKSGNYSLNIQYKCFVVLNQTLTHPLWFGLMFLLLQCLKCKWFCNQIWLNVSGIGTKLYNYQLYSLQHSMYSFSNQIERQIQLN